MGVPPQHLLNNKGIALENKGSTNCITIQRVKLRQTKKKQMHMKKKKKKERVSMRRMIVTRVEKRVRTLKRLIPNRPETQGSDLDGLFRDTATYIMSLQMRVRVMQVMVDVFASSREY